MHARFLHYACYVLGGLLLSARAASANDLLDVLQRAFTEDAALRSQAQQRAAGQEGRPQALAVLLPQITATGDVLEDRYGPQQPRIVGSSNDAGLSITQTLWSLESFQRLRAASLDAAEAEADFQAAVQDLILRVAEAYFRVLSAADQLTTNRAAREAFAELVRQARVREETGIGPRTALVQAESFYDATLQPVIDAENEYEDARRALAQITGAYRESLAELREEVPAQAPAAGSAEDWVARALTGNPSLLAAQLRTDAAGRRLDAARASGLPTITARGSLARLRQDATLGPDSDLERVGIGLTWPLFQGGAVASRTREARARHRQAQADQEGLEREVERLTRRAYRGLETGVARIAAGRRAMESTQAAIDGVRNGLEFGTSSEFELLNAQNQHFFAQRTYRQARFDQILESLRLARQVGTLGEADLRRIDALLVETAAGAA